MNITIENIYLFIFYCGAPGLAGKTSLSVFFTDCKAPPVLLWSLAGASNPWGFIPAAGAGTGAWSRSHAAAILPAPNLV